LINHESANRATTPKVCIDGISSPPAGGDSFVGCSAAPWYQLFDNRSQMKVPSRNSSNRWVNLDTGTRLFASQQADPALL